MSQHWIFINSPGYRNFVERTKQRPSLLWGATAAASLVAAAAAFITMSTTNPGSEEKSRQTDEAEYRKLPMHTQVCLDVEQQQPAYAGRHCSKSFSPHHGHSTEHDCTTLCWLQVIARTNREHLRAMMKDIESGTDKARYRDLLE
jgi:hypothetical protein